MYDNQARPANIIPGGWILDSLRSVRDQLQDEGREHLAAALSIAIGGLDHLAPPLPTMCQPRPIRPLLTVLAERRSLADGGPDFEDSAEWSLDDVVGLTDLTPLDVLARDFALPALSGGAPFVPSADDWSDYAAYCELADDLDNQEDARACGLAI